MLYCGGVGRWGGGGGTFLTFFGILLLGYLAIIKLFFLNIK